MFLPPKIKELKSNMDKKHVSNVNKCVADILQGDLKDSEGPETESRRLGVSAKLAAACLHEFLVTNIKSLDGMVLKAIINAPACKKLYLEKNGETMDAVLKDVFCCAMNTKRWNCAAAIHEFTSSAPKSIILLCAEDAVRDSDIDKTKNLLDYICYQQSCCRECDEFDEDHFSYAILSEFAYRILFYKKRTLYNMIVQQFPEFEQIFQKTIAKYCVNCCTVGENSFKCANCKKVVYCTTACQKKHLPIHQADCRRD